MTTIRTIYAQELTRTGRISLLLLMVLTISLADLTLTLWASHWPAFYELNPLARSLLSAGSPWPIIVFKLGFTGLAFAIFWHLRKHPLAEVGLWLVATVYMALAFHWSIITHLNRLA